MSGEGRQDFSKKIAAVLGLDGNAVETAEEAEQHFALFKTFWRRGLDLRGRGEKRKRLPADNPSVGYADSSLYTREP